MGRNLSGLRIRKIKIPQYTSCDHLTLKLLPTPTRSLPWNSCMASGTSGTSVLWSSTSRFSNTLQNVMEEILFNRRKHECNLWFTVLGSSLKTTPLRVSVMHEVQCANFPVRECARTRMDGLLFAVNHAISCSTYCSPVHVYEATLMTPGVKSQAFRSTDDDERLSTSVVKGDWRH